MKVFKIPTWLEVALQELQADVREVPGPGDNPRVVEYHQSCTLKATDDDVPWCSAFVNWVMQRVGYNGTKSAAAISWAKWGRELENGRLGCIVVMSRTGGNHVGFYLDEDQSGVYILGGNQGNRVSVTRTSWDVVTNFRFPKNYTEEAV